MTKKLKRNNSQIQNWVDENKGRFAVDSNGIYDFKIGEYNWLDGRFHHAPFEVFGWVDRSAHTALFGGNSYGELYYLLAYGPYPNDLEKDIGYSGTASLIKSAQQASAGFIKFFFDSVDLPVSYSTETQTNQEEITPPPTRFTSFNRVASSVKEVKPVHISTEYAYDTIYPDIYESKVVWSELNPDDMDIYMEDLSTGIESPITTATDYQENPAIYGNIVVWDDSRVDMDIYMKDLLTGLETPIATGPTTYDSWQQRPAIYQNKIVWQDDRNWWPRTSFENRRSDIYLYDLSTNTETQITTGSSSRSIYPAIYGNKIVWSDYRNGSRDIYLYDLSVDTDSDGIPNYLDSDRPNPDPAEQQITFSLEGEIAMDPDIYQDKVVYDSYGGSPTHHIIYLKDLTTGNTTRVSNLSDSQATPKIYKNIVVWEDWRSGNSSDIYMKNLKTGIETPVTTNSAEQYYPDIYNNKIVWEDSRINPGPGVYMAELE